MKAHAAAIYTRISQDDSGDRLGVQRQEQACRTVAEQKGWTVAEVYQDNDISAFKGARRPQYERMLADLASGERDGVLVYHVDRLTRRPIELERFMEVCDGAKVANIATVTGDLDLSNHDGRFMARLLGNIASKESAQKSDRVKAAARQRAEAGKVAGGGLRPFGFEPDRKTVRESEADVVRQLVPRFLAGESLSSLATWLADNEIPTVTGREWRTPTVRALLGNPRYAGLRAYHGEVVAPAEWPAIITRRQHEQVVAEFAHRKMTTRRTPRRYLLSGLLQCAKCGAVMFSQPRSETFNQPRTYACRKGPDHGGCGGTRINAEPVEEWIAEAVLFRLDSPAMQQAMSGRTSDDERQASIAAEVQDSRAQLEDLARLWANRQISVAEWRAAREPIEDRIRSAERRLARVTRTTALDGWIGNGSALRHAWEDLPLTRQAAIVRAIVHHVTVGPGKPGARTLTVERLTPTWNL